MMALTPINSGNTITPSSENLHNDIPRSALTALATPNATPIVERIAAPRHARTAIADPGSP